MSYVADESQRVVTQVASQPGRCLNLNGADQYVLASGMPPVAFPFSYSIWFNADTTTVGTPLAITNNGIGVFRAFFSSGSLYIGRRFDSSEVTTLAVAAASMPAGVWHHIVVVFHTATHVTIYLNGALAYDNAALSSVPAAANLTFVSIGTLYYNGGLTIQFHDGKLFDARVYNRALTAAEAVNIFNTSRPGGRPQDALYAANLVAHWKLDDGRSRTIAATACYDSSGNGYHGGLINGATSSRHEGADVPFSWQNEVGFSDLDDISLPSAWVVKDDVDDWASWTATGVASTALSGQAWNGSTGLYAARFTNGAVGGYANNRVASGAGVAGLLANYVHVGEVEIAFSRPLVSGESIRCYFVGSQTGPILDIDHGDEHGTTFKKYFGSTINYAATWSSWFVVHPISNITGGDLTIYVRHAKLVQAMAQADAGSLDGRWLAERISASSANVTQDIFDNALTYRGPLGRQAALLDSNCGTFDGVDDKATGVGRATTGTINALTVTARLRRNSQTGTKELIREWAASNQSWAIDVSTATGQIIFYLSQNGTAVGSVTFAYNIPLSVWTHVAVQYDSTGPNVKLFIDGVLVETVSRAETSLFNGVSNVTVGNTLGASICNMQVYQAALSTADVLALANGGTIATQPRADWAFSEGDDDTIHDSSGNGKHLTLTGHAISTFWGTKQSVYHRNISKGHRIATATGAGRTFDGTSQYFAEPIASLPLVHSGANAFWFAVYCNLDDVAAQRTLLARWNASGNQRGLHLYVSASGYQWYASANGTTSTGVPAAGAAVAGVDQFVFAAFDNVANQLQLAVDSGSVQVNSFSGPIFNSTAPFTVGAKGDFTERLDGDIELVAMGICSPTLFATIRDTIRNGGTPLSYEDLTAQQKSDWGVTIWCDCDEREPLLRDKHNGYTFAGNNMPRIPARNDGLLGADGGAITNPAGSWHNGAETKINFTGGVSAPFTDKMFLGYAGMTGTLAGPLVTTAIVGNVTNAMSIYARFRNPDPTGGNLAFFSADNGAGANVAAAMLKTGWDLTLYDLTYNDVSVGGAPVLDDGNWHDALFVWKDTQGWIYLDGELQGELAMADLGTYAPNWTRARILSHQDGTVNRFVGDIARIVVQNKVVLPSTQFSGTPLLDVRFDHGRVADQQGRIPVVHAQSGLAFPKVNVPTAHVYRSAIPTGFTRSIENFKESRYALKSIDV